MKNIFHENKWDKIQKKKQQEKKLKKKLEKAVNLSEERYCGVSYVYKKYINTNIVNIWIHGYRGATKEGL